MPHLSIPNRLSTHNLTLDTTRRRSHHDLKNFNYDPNSTSDVSQGNAGSTLFVRKLEKALSRTTDRVTSLFTFKDPSIAALEAYAKSPKAQKLVNKKDAIASRKLPQNATKPYQKTPHELQRIAALKKEPKFRHRSMRLSGSEHSSSESTSRGSKDDMRSI